MESVERFSVSVMRDLKKKFSLFGPIAYIAQMSGLQVHFELCHTSGVGERDPSHSPAPCGQTWGWSKE